MSNNQSLPDRRHHAKRDDEVQQPIAAYEPPPAGSLAATLLNVAFAFVPIA